MFHLLPFSSNLFAQRRIGHSMRWNVQYSPYLKDKILLICGELKKARRMVNLTNGPHEQIRRYLEKSAKTGETAILLPVF